MIPPPPSSTLFPYTTLFRSTLILALPRPKMLKRILIDATSLGVKRIILLNSWKVEKSYWQTPELHAKLLQEKLLLGDRKSTRLNSSHVRISYAVFCLKKKKK